MLGMKGHREGGGVEGEQQIIAREWDWRIEEGMEWYR